MKIEVNEILLRRKNKVNVVAMNDMSDNHAHSLLVAMLKNFEALGYGVDKDLFAVLATYDADTLGNFYKEVMPILRKLTGADKSYKLMYPNFPQQVKEASDGELLFNALFHYFTYGQWVPSYEKDERLPLMDETNLKILSVGSNKDLIEIFQNLVSAKTSLSDQDKADVEWFIVNCSDFDRYLPDEIPLKENVALVGKLIVQKAPVEDAVSIQKYFKTATDVLRLAVALSDGDISLAENTKFKHFNRRERRMLMNLLNNCGNILEDMFRYQGQWLRLGEIIHPATFDAKKYGKVIDAFAALRSGKKPLMFAGKVQQLIEKNDSVAAAELLKSRPGDFARQLDKLLRDANDDMVRNYICADFSEVANEVSAPVLLQVREHFKHRAENNRCRVAFPKGNVAKAIVIDADLPSISSIYCYRVVHICENALIDNYRHREDLGAVYLDRELKNYLVPFSQRSASSGSKIVVRGSHIPMNKHAKVVRAFIWWTNTDNSDWDRVDIDLSMTAFDEDWNYKDHVSYTRLRSDRLRAYHSGDMIDGGPVDGDGVSEFLDVDVESAAKVGRYLVFQIYSYSSQNFCALPNCRFGFMEREDVNSGEVFEPRTVEMNMDVTAVSKVAIPAIFDTKKREFIWTDMNIGVSRLQANNVENNVDKVKEVCKAMVNMQKPNLYDLVFLNVLGRGYFTQNRNDADIIFSNDKTPPIREVAERIATENGYSVSTKTEEKTGVPIITAFDCDYIVGKLL